MKPLWMLALLISPFILTAPAALGQTSAAAAKSKNARSAADGPISTGGGGLVRPKGQKPMTLADAGYVFKQVEEKVLKPEYQDYYEVSEETKAALRQILRELPVALPDFLAEQILGGVDRSTFVRQSKVNAKDYAQIGSVYSSVIRSFGQKLDPSIFMLIAYSKGAQTFILPDFDHPEVTPEQRALNLIHEWNMRGGRENQSPTEAQTRLRRALIIDYAIHQYRKSARTNADAVEFFVQIEKLTTQFHNDHAYHRALNAQVAQLIGQVEAKAGRPLLMSEFFLMRYGFRPSANEAMDPNLVQHFDALVPGVAERLGSLRFYLDHVSDIAVNFGFAPDYNSETNGIRRYEDIPPGQTSVNHLTEKYKQAEPFVVRANVIMEEQCAQNGHLLQASKMKRDALFHYDEVLNRVMVITCFDPKPYASILWTTSRTKW